MDLKTRSVGYFEGILSIIINTLLFGLKLHVGSQTGSVAIVADAWHTLSDTLTSLVVIIGFWAASRPKDKEHPFGHGRAELIGGLVIGVLLGLVGINFLKEAALQLRNREAILFSTSIIWVFAISFIAKEAIAQYSIRMGKRIGSTSLVADGWHHRSDAVASLLILFGSFLGRWLWWIDGVLGIIVSVLILYVAFDVIREAADSILGEPPSADLMQNIEDAVADAPGPLSDPHHILFHRYGENGAVSFHLRAPGNLPLERAHTLTTTIEREITARTSFQTTIHLEPLSNEE